VTLPNLNARLMASVPVVLPPRPLQDAFERTTFPMAQLVEVLLRQNANLRATRDLLLPRLMAGRISLPGVEADLQAKVLGAGG
jgi:type I restriction enzyme S subunit